MPDNHNRFLVQPFAEDSNANGVFGSYLEGNPTLSNDPAVIQGGNAWKLGWESAVQAGNFLPTLEEFQGVQYVSSKAVKELYSEGVPQWIEGETYYKNTSICSYTHNGICKLYLNITGNNGSNPPSQDRINWTVFGEKVSSTVPVGSIMALAGNNNPDGWLPCNGSVIEEEDYPDLYPEIENIYNNYYYSMAYLPFYVGKSLVFNNIGNTMETLTDNAYISNFVTYNGQYYIMPHMDNTGMGFYDTWEVKMGIEIPSARLWGLVQGSNLNNNYKDVLLELQTNNIFRLYLSADGSDWNLLNAAVGTTALQYNKKYVFRLGFDGTKYYLDILDDDGTTWNNEITFESTTKVATHSDAPRAKFGNVYNETGIAGDKFYIKDFKYVGDGEVICSGEDLPVNYFEKKETSSPLANYVGDTILSSYQPIVNRQFTISSVNSQHIRGKKAGDNDSFYDWIAPNTFTGDDPEGVVRQAPGTLPLINDARFIQGSSTSGGYLDAGLPNLTGWFGVPQRNSGVPADDRLFKNVQSGFYYAASKDWDGAKIVFNANNYNNIYKDNVNTVLPKSIKLRYFIKY